MCCISTTIRLKRFLNISTLFLFSRWIMKRHAYIIEFLSMWNIFKNVIFCCQILSNLLFIAIQSLIMQCLEWVTWDAPNVINNALCYEKYVLLQICEDFCCSYWALLYTNNNIGMYCIYWNRMNNLLEACILLITYCYTFW